MDHPDSQIRKPLLYTSSIQNIKIKYMHYKLSRCELDEYKYQGRVGNMGQCPSLCPVFIWREMHALRICMCSPECKILKILQILYRYEQGMESHVAKGRTG